MKIAQIAPVAESVPPRLYGGTERVVSILTEELVRQGHDVTLFASGDSLTAARLVPCCDRALRLNEAIRDPLPHQLVALEEVRRRARQFDVLHFHIDLLHFPLVHSYARRTVTTLHNRLDLPDLIPFFRAYPQIPLVAISASQRRAMPRAAWAGTVHHGLPRDALPFQPHSAGNYLAFLGRISPEKGPDRAIRIASEAGMPLKIAAKIDRGSDRAYWDEVIRPMIAGRRDIEFVGEIDEAAKPRFLGEARALLFPIAWPEPFGLVAIEAMACGTPVIAFPRGAIPEIIDDGESGFLVDDVDAAVMAVRRLDRLDRARVRACFERRFTAERMANDYLAIYRRLARPRRSAKGLGVGAQAGSMLSEHHPDGLPIGNLLSEST